MGSLTLIRRQGPILQPEVLQDTKDPCPVFDGRQWHMFGSVGSSLLERWHIFHAVAPQIEGPWRELEPSQLIGVSGNHVAAPGLLWDGAWLHMFVQTDHAALGGTIEHLVSDDGGRTFTRLDTALTSQPEVGEATIYDPHPAEIHGVRYIVYSAGEKVGAPDIHLACSSTGSWNGPWRRLGAILRHEDVPHHNVRDQPDYEWGLEGPQLVPLPNGTVLLNAVCFLPNREKGTRQRVFFAVADSPAGPYRTLGPMLEPAMDAAPWESGENGHASAFMADHKLLLFYQARGRGSDAQWRYGVAEFAVDYDESATGTDG
ncbi:MAG TPA: hypothetical protein VFE86_05520 [Ilumatobacteraceae bacterium]|nr:hypothetical protein [Ilumatobacteraceae bacterium]